MIGKWEDIEYDSRCFTLTSIDSANAKDLVNFIMYINHIDKINLEKNKEWKVEPIRLIVNSFGGEVYDAFGIIAAIDASETPVHTYAYGSVMSAALPVFLAGKKRFIHPLCTFMYHEISTSYEGPIEGQKGDTKEGLRLQKDFDDYIFKHSKLTRRRLTEVKSKKQDWYFSAKEAAKYKMGTLV